MIGAVVKGGMVVCFEVDRPIEEAGLYELELDHILA